MGYYMSEYFQNFHHLIKIYIQCTIQNSQTSERFCCLLYVGGSDLEEFEVFIAGILRWLKMNCLLGEASIDMQVDYLGTHLTGKAQEWFYRNVEQYDHQVHNWTLETVVQGLQKRFLHTLTHHHVSNKFYILL